MWLSLSIASAVFWATVNVLNSTLVARYHKNPLFLLATQAAFSCFLLLWLAMVVPIRTTWVLVIVLSGCIAYLGDMLFFWILDRVDISVVNAAWAILALFLSIGGFVLFGERWSPLQFAGAGLILTGVLLISFYHAHVSMTRTVGMLALLALLYVPFHIVRKAALLHGESMTAIFFWMLLGREMLSFIVPFATIRSRRIIMQGLRSMPWGYFAVSVVIILLYYCAELSSILAYRIGPISLVSVVSNVQPFFVVIFAWLLMKLQPSIAPRELLCTRSVAVKIGGFSVVFAGLALLAWPQ